MTDDKTTVAPRLTREERAAKRDRENYRRVAPYGTIQGVQRYRGHQLSEAQKQELREAADSKCYKCQGSGVKDWRYHGLKARICVCAKKNLNKEENNG